jgi:hypothetical protein
MSLLHVDNLALDDKGYTDVGADSMLRGSFSGLHPVGSRGTGQHAANGQCCSVVAYVPCSQSRQGEQGSIGQPATGARAAVGGDQRGSCQPGVACVCAGRGVAEEGSSVSFAVQMAAPGEDLPQKIKSAGEGVRAAKS